MDSDMRLALEASTAELLDLIKQLALPLVMDEPTPGRGNCFFAAVCQQLRRPEVGLEKNRDGGPRNPQNPLLCTPL